MIELRNVTQKYGALTVYENFSLSLEEGTVKSRIFRARKKLCKILSGDGNFPAEISSDKAKGV